VGIDSTVVRAHQHASGARHAPPRDLPAEGAGVDHGSNTEGLGRSRGGLSAKIHLITDWHCRPIVRLTSPSQHGDSLRASLAPMRPRRTQRWWYRTISSTTAAARRRSGGGACASPPTVGSR
jgi:hypothetical protein